MCICTICIQSISLLHVNELRDLSSIPSYNVPFREFIKFNSFEGIGLVKTLYMTGIVFVTAFSLLSIMRDYIDGNPTRIILGLVFTAIFWFASLILLRVVAECVISCISVTHLIPILSKRVKEEKRNNTVMSLMVLIRMDGISIIQAQNVKKIKKILANNSKQLKNTFYKSTRNLMTQPFA